MTTASLASIFTPQALRSIFPRERTDQFFDALFGDASEGAYDIELAYCGDSAKSLQMELVLHQRPGHCLACNLTQGLPQVFTRHPVINLSGLVQELEKLGGGAFHCTGWSLGATVQQSRERHCIPLTIGIERA